MSHLYAFFVSIVAAVALVATAPSGTATFGAAVYGITLVGMFGASALYHRGNWSPPVARRLLQLDHTAIFLLIAGTYTPIGLLATSGTAETVLLPLVWIVATGGIIYEWLPVPAPRGYVTAVYLALGWIGAFAMVSLWENAGTWGVLLIAAGGICYTIGAIVHAAPPRPVARDVRLPRDLPRVRHPRGGVAVHRDRVLRAPARLPLARRPA